MQHSWFSNDCHPPSTAATKVLWVSLSDKWNTNSTNFPLIFNKISQKIKLHSPKSKNGCLEDGVPFARMNIGWSTMVPIACPIMVHMSMRAFWVFSWDSPKTNQDHWFISNPNSAICWSQKKSKHSLLCFFFPKKKSYKFIILLCSNSVVTMAIPFHQAQRPARSHVPLAGRSPPNARGPSGRRPRPGRDMPPNESGPESPTRLTGWESNTSFRIMLTPD